MRKLLLILAFLFTTFFVASKLSQTFADVAPPDYFMKDCNSDEEEIACYWKTEKPGGPRVSDDCIKYENNPNYRYLVGRGSSFGGETRYCFKAVSKTSYFWIKIFPTFLLFILNLLIEIPLFILFGFRNLSKLITIFLMNLISFTSLYLFTYFYFKFIGFGSVNNTGDLFSLLRDPLFLLIVYWPIILGESVVIIFEAFFIRFRHKDIRLKRAFIYSFIVNLISSTLGTFLGIKLLQMI